MNNPYKTYWKYYLLTIVGILFFLPVGISNFIRFMKLSRADKIGDTETIENCKKHIRIGSWIMFGFYVFAIIVSLFDV